jgi:lipopolysaccharide transport system ATP-binding protein
MKDPVILFEGVTKSYPSYEYVLSGFKNFILNFPRSLKHTRKKFTVLKDLTFSIYEGEFFGIIGRNGVGKSTLLALIAGVLKPDAGRIEVKKRVHMLLELGAGFHPDLTGRENIILNGVLLGMTKKEVLKKMDEIIAFSELENFIDQPVRTYSSGMLARLGFSVVAHLEPEILLIDEVLAVGDVKFQKKCLKKILEFKERGVTIIYVSHNVNEVSEFCDRAMWLNDTHIQAIGSAQEIVSAYLKFLENSNSS